jgi:hypothetical protein
MDKILVVAALTMLGCGVGELCAGTSRCSADPQASIDSDISFCRGATRAATTCQSEFTGLYQCKRNKQVCDSSNVTDITATLAGCSSEYAAWTSCRLAPNDGGNP